MADNPRFVTSGSIRRLRVGIERPVSRGTYRAGIASMTRDQSGEDKMSAQKSLDRKLSVYLIAFLIICIDIGLVAWVLGSYVY